jgi:signal recognition particle receptor subunit beta
MPTFDRKQGIVNVRIVYDGPAHAGKTENLRQLHLSFAPTRRGDLVSPEEREGRTRYFDWLHLSGGIVAGLPLRAQLVTVPGQSALARRRWALVAAADAIVFVCESSTTGVRAGRRSLELLRAKLATAGRKPQLIVQANKQDLDGALPPAKVLVALGLPPETIVVPASAVKGTGMRETVVHAIRAAAAATERLLVGSAPESLPPSSDASDLLGELIGARDARAAIDGPLPPLPEEDAPPGWVAPARDGRRLVRFARKLVREVGVERVPAESSIVLRAGAACLKTSPSPFATEDDALAALRSAAEVRASLGRLRPLDTVHALAWSGGFWLWTSMPWLESLASEMRAAREAGDEARAREVLDAYVRALAHAAEVANVWGLELDLDPSHFARQGDRVVYLRAGAPPPLDAARRREAIRRGLATLAHTPAERAHVAQAMRIAGSARGGVASAESQRHEKEEA